MLQETMTLVDENSQSYAQHIEMKEAELTACKNEFIVSPSRWKKLQHKR
jgi:hypothetical protein